MSKELIVARELAMDLRPIDDVLASLGMTREELDAMASSRSFKAMVEEIATRFHAAENTEARSKLKAQLAVEELITRFAIDALNPSLPLVQRVEAGKWLLSVARDGTERSNATTADGFRVTINIGKDPVVIESQPVASEDVFD